jgi:hypothetical protein
MESDLISPLLALLSVLDDTAEHGRNTVEAWRNTILGTNRYTIDLGATGVGVRRYFVR